MKVKFLSYLTSSTVRSVVVDLFVIIHCVLFQTYKDVNTDRRVLFETYRTD